MSTLRISQLISALESAKTKHGDLPVTIVTWWECNECDIAGVALVNTTQTECVQREEVVEIRSGVRRRVIRTEINVTGHCKELRIWFNHPTNGMPDEESIVEEFTTPSAPDVEE